MEESTLLPTLIVDAPVDGEPNGAPIVVEPAAQTTIPRISVGESVMRGALAILSAQPLTWAITFLLATAAPRYLGSQALGQYTLAMTITVLATTVLGLGIPDFLTRRVAQRPGSAQRDVAVAMFLQTITMVCGALLIAFVVPLAAPAMLDPRLLDLALIAMILAPNQNLLLAALRGREQHGHYAWLNATWWVIGTGGSVVALFLGADVLTYTATGVVLTSIATLLNWKMSGLRVSVPRPNLELVSEFRQLIRGGLPFLSWNVTLTIYGSIDRVLLGIFVPSYELGWYAAAYRVIGITAFIPSLLTTPLLPAVSRNLHQPETLRRAIAQTLRVALLFTVPMSAGFFIVAPVVPVLFGWPADFDSAVPLMMILSLHIPIVAVDMLLGTVIMAIGREGRWVKVGLAAAAFNVAANLVCIPLFQNLGGNGAIGAAVTTVLTEVMMFFGALYLIPHNLIDRDVAWQALRIVFAGVATGIVGVATLRISLPLCVIASALTYVALGALLRAFTLQDLLDLRDRFAKRPESSVTTV